MKHNRTTFKLSCFIRKTRILKNGEVSIFLRVSVNGENCEIIVKRSIPPKLWDQRKECSIGKDRSSLELNHYIEILKSKLYDIHRQMEHDGICITARKVCDRYLGKDIPEEFTIVKLFEQHNAECDSLIGNGYCKNTVKKFGTSLRNLQDFLLLKWSSYLYPHKELSHRFYNFMAMKRRKTYDRAFKENAVNLSHSRSDLSTLARELGLSSDSLYRWRKESQQKGSERFPGKGNSFVSVEAKSDEALLKKIKRLEQENEILKKAMAIISRSDL